ncbi:hypothetical protein OG749_16490 [Streptomyces nojiriensis]|uniref:hypothetical protein n=1 Tax=Streptomyces nojiriensis TaxID=66374 RepID=UPI002E1937AE
MSFGGPFARPAGNLSFAQASDVVWIPPRTDAQRRRRLALGSIGCPMAFLHPHLVLIGWLTLWALSGG